MPLIALNRLNATEKLADKFLEWLVTKKRLAKTTIDSMKWRIKRLREAVANLYDSDAVERFVREGSFENGYRNQLLNTYRLWLEFRGFKYSFKKYATNQKLPYIPLETEIDQLIAGFSKKYSAFLQLIKETGFRPIEAGRLTREDFDFKRKVVTLNKPAKNGLPRQRPLSEKLVQMLQVIIKDDKRIWKAKPDNIKGNFYKTKKNVAKKLNNPRLQRITLKALRHWKATMEYHKTRDILHVKELLGHKRLDSTLVYTHLIETETDEWTVRVTSNLEELTQLLEAGFEYVTDYEGKKILRKRK